MRWTCRKAACQLVGLFMILPGCYIYEHMEDFKIIELLRIILVIICLVTLACNNYRIRINEKELLLEKVIGRDLYIDMKRVWKIVVLSKAGEKELWMYSQDKVDHFSISSFDTDEIADYLRQIADRNQAIYTKQEIVEDCNL